MLVPSVSVPSLHRERCGVWDVGLISQMRDTKDVALGACCVGGAGVAPPGKLGVSPPSRRTDSNE